jgi:hypothetical protein
MLSSILLLRLSPYIDEIIGDRQCGFRRSRSTTEQFFFSLSFVRYLRKPAKLVRYCHHSLIQLAERNKVIWVPGNEGIVGNETAISWQEQDLNIHSQDLNQLTASHLEWPKKWSGT